MDGAIARGGQSEAHRVRAIRQSNDSRGSRPAADSEVQPKLKVGVVAVGGEGGETEGGDQGQQTMAGVDCYR